MDPELLTILFKICRHIAGGSIEDVDRLCSLIWTILLLTNPEYYTTFPRATREDGESYDDPSIVHCLRSMGLRFSFEEQVMYVRHDSIVYQYMCEIDILHLTGASLDVLVVPECTVPFALVQTTLLPILEEIVPGSRFGQPDTLVELCTASPLYKTRWLREIFGHN